MERRHRSKSDWTNQYRGNREKIPGGRGARKEPAFIVFFLVCLACLVWRTVERKNRERKIPIRIAYAPCLSR